VTTAELYAPSGTNTSNTSSNTPEASAVFSDWLDVTFGPDEELTWLDEFVKMLGGVPQYQGKTITYQLGFSDSSLRYTQGSAWQRLCIPGGVLQELRAFELEYGAIDTLVEGLMQQPHKITRLDASMDVYGDAAPVIQGLWNRYQQGPVNLSGKPVKCSAILSAREDGQVSGTFYAGDMKRVEVGARVYDKKLEEWDRRRTQIPPTTRYEIVIRTGAVTVGDFLNPAPVFWHYAVPGLLPSMPAGGRSWTPGNDFTWSAGPRKPVNYAQRITDTLAFSVDLERAVNYAKLMGDAGKEYLLRAFRIRLQHDFG